MTIEQAIEELDSLKRNTYTAEDKLRWLMRLEMRIYKEVVQTHAGWENVPFPELEEATLATELIAPEPFAQMYLNWLDAQMDYYNGEITLYNEAITLFNAAYEDYKNWYNREHLPLQTAGLRYF